MARNQAERDLLIALMAHSRGRLDRAAMLAGLERWTTGARKRSLVEILIEDGALDPRDLPALRFETDRDSSEDSGLDRVFKSIDLKDAPSIDAAAASLAKIRPSLAAADPSAVTQVHRSDVAGWTLDRGDLAESFSGDDTVDADTNAARFQIIKLLARGGLGEVYVAHDAEVGRTVALKVMRPEVLRNDSLRGRFLRESEINGNLEHPGIIPVYGKGTFPDGRPYYAMRLVEGGTLQQAIKRFHSEAAARPRSDEWSLRVRPLLRRFLVVCEAIAYAHGRGVLHRDLKPSNILLGPFGETLIIDWGLAKLRNTAEGSLADTLIAESNVAVLSGSTNLVIHGSSAGEGSTIAGETLGSPQYMSPEQARGDHQAVGEASDVYGLGATLYCLLTDQPPVSGQPLRETLRRVGAGQIEPIRTLNPSVPGALAAICEQAMRFDPDARYRSARALADDLERWLADEPVASYREPWTTHLARWSRRHKAQVAAALGLLVAGLLGLAVNNVLVEGQKSIALAAQRDAVQAEAETAKALGQALEAQRRARGHLAVGTALIGQLIELGDRQLVARLPGAARLQFLERATDFNRQFREREPENLELRQNAAESDRRLANLSRLMGEPLRARDLLTGAIEAFESLPATPTVLDLRAQSRMDLGDTYSLLGRFDQAEAAFRDARADAVNLVETTRGDPAAQRSLARALDRLGSIAQLRGNPGEAEASLRAAVNALVPIAAGTPEQILAAFRRDDSGPLYDQLSLIGARVRLAEVQADLGQTDARTQLDLARDQMNELSSSFGAGISRDVDFYGPWVAIHHVRARLDGGDHGEAAERLEDALRGLERLEAEDPGQPHIRRASAEARLELARAANSEGRFDDAEIEAKRALERIGIPEPPATDPEAELLRGAMLLEQGGAILDGEDPTRRGEARAALEAANLAVKSAESAGLHPPRLTRAKERLRIRLARLGDPTPAPEF